MRTPTPHAPGWYPDGDDVTRVRYWDGQGWTERLRPRPVWAPLDGEWAGPPALRRRPRRGVRARFMAAVALVVVAALVVGGVVATRAGSASRPPAPRALTTPPGSRYAKAANAVCAGVIGRASAAAQAPPAATAVSPAAAGALAQDARAIDTKLLALPTQPNNGEVHTWLQAWATLVATASRYAGVRTHGAHEPTLRAALDRARGQVDHLATVDGISQCHL